MTNTWKYDLNAKIVNINNIDYKYNTEYLYCGQKSPTSTIVDLQKENSNDIYPQGIEYCKNFIEQQQEQGEMFLILTKNESPKSIHFMFPIKSLLDLQFQVVKPRFIYKIEHFQKELTQSIEQYDNDIYPQGIEYCKSLLTEQMNANGCVHLINKISEGAYTKYYFKCKNKQNIPTEKFNFYSGQERLEYLINIIKKSPPNSFPQGIQYCLTLSENEKSNNGSVFMVGDESNKVHFLFTDDDIEVICSGDWWPFNFKKERKLIHERKKQDFYPQGLKYVFSLIDEQEKNGGKIHVLVCNASKSVWFYLKAK